MKKKNILKLVRKLQAKVECLEKTKADIAKPIKRGNFDVTHGGSFNREKLGRSLYRVNCSRSL